MGDSDLLKDNLVSIIMPAYNAEKYIKDAVDSVIKQTYTNWELIIIDDCSSDGTEKMIKKYQDRRIRYIKNKKNQGAVLSRNKGMRISSGRYVAFLDSDDMWEPRKLQRQLNLLQNKGYFMSYSGIKIVNENGNFIKYYNVPKQMNYNKLLRNTAIATSSVVLDRGGLVKL